MLAKEEITVQDKGDSVYPITGEASELNLSELENKLTNLGINLDSALAEFISPQYLLAANQFDDEDVIISVGRESNHDLFTVYELSAYHTDRITADIEAQGINLERVAEGSFHAYKEGEDIDLDTVVNSIAGINHPQLKYSLAFTEKLNSFYSL